MKKCRTLHNNINQAGFSLIEVMIVVAILGILSAIAIPAYSGYTTQAKTTVQRTNFDIAVTLVRSELEKKAGGGTASIDVVAALNSPAKKSPFDNNVDAYANGTSAHTTSIVINPSNLNTATGTVTVFRPTSHPSGINTASTVISID